MTEETAEQKLKRHEDALVACMAEIEKLRAENASLKANATSHQTLKEIYGNPAEPTSNRIRAATAALGVETPSLKPQPSVLDLVGEEIEPLAVVVERQRKRCDALQGRNIEVTDSGVRVLDNLLPMPGNGGDGQGE